MAHPNNAAFISGDGLVSFDEYGRKLDGLGNVVHGDYQSLRGANAQPNEAYWQRKFEEEMRAMQPPAPPPQAQGMTPGLAVGGVGAGEMGSGGAGAAPVPTMGSGAAPVPTMGSAPRVGTAAGQGNAAGNRWQPPPSGLNGQGGLSGQGAPPRYDPLSSAVPGSQRTVQNYVAGLGLPMPDNQRFDPPPQNRPMPPAMGAPLPPAPRGGAMGGQGGLNGQGALPSPYAPGAGEMGMPQVGQMGDNRRPGLMHVGGPAPAMPTRDQRPQPMPQPMSAPPPPMGTPMAPRMGTPTPQPMGTPMPPARAPTWTPYQPYGVNAPLPGLSREDEESINRAVLWR